MKVILMAQYEMVQMVKLKPVDGNGLHYKRSLTKV